tara:strand:+ start:14834 stop:15415 length:582 start_codon:yes stop_codon:yes gene_type:complete
MSKYLFLSATDLEHNELEIFGSEIHIIGVGKINAAMNTTRLIEKYNPSHVINFGSCGNLQNHKIGEVLTVGKVYNNIDVRPFAEYGHTPFHGLGAITLQGKSDIKCFSTDQFYDKHRTDYADKYLEMVKKCDIVDMELYSIAQVCSRYNKLLYSFKWISDDGDSSKWEENAKKGYINFKQRIKELFTDGKNLI